MALKIKLVKTNSLSDDPRRDYYIGEEGDWTVEISTLAGEQPTSADLHVEFYQEDEVDESTG